VTSTFVRVLSDVDEVEDVGIRAAKTLVAT
jgi:hypothetical protein